MSYTINDILNDSSLAVDEKVEKITQYFASCPDQGVAEALHFVFNTDDSDAATFPANYLALLPNLQKEKQQVVEYVLKNKHLVIAATNLVKYMPDDIVNKLIDEYFKDPSQAEFYSVFFEVAHFFPEKLHPFASQIEDKLIHELILPGGPDSWVDDLVKSYRQDKHPEHLKTLAWFRTDKALDALLTIMHTAPKNYLKKIYAYLESSGVFPDTRFASVYFNSYRGFIVPRSESPHHMGGNFPHAVPKCPVTNTPASRIVTLDVSQLDLDLESGYSPSFFWYESGYPPDCIYVQFTKDGIKGLATPMTDGEAGTDLIPGELALKLEECPGEYGRAGTAIPGYSNYQVGGYPSWIKFERFPRCPICSKGMKFLVSMDSGMTPFGKIGFRGILYGFWCDPCAVSCTYQQTDEE